MIQMQKFQKQVDLEKKIEELSSIYQISVSDYQDVINGILSEFNLDSLIDKLPFEFSFYDGIKSLQDVIAQLNTDFDNELFYNYFEKYKKETKITSKLILEKESNKFPFHLGIKVPISENSKSDFNIESIALALKNDHREGFKTAFLNACEIHLQAKTSKLASKIASADIDLFKSFIVGYYDALTDAYISDGMDAIENDTAVKSLNNYTHEEILEDLLENENGLDEVKSEEDDTNNVYQVQVDLKIYSYYANLTTSFKGKKFSEFKGVFSEGIKVNEFVNASISESDQSELPEDLENNKDQILSFTLSKDGKSIVIWFEASSIKIGLGLRAKEFFYIGFEVTKNKEGNYEPANAVDEALQFLRINKVNLLYKKDAATQVDYDFSEKHTNSELKLFNKNFLKNYNLIVGASVNLNEIDAFKAISSSFNLKTIDGYVAVNTKKKGVAAITLNIDEVGDEAFKVKDFNLSAFVNKGSKDFGFSIGGTMIFKLDDEKKANSTLSVTSYGKITTTGFYISASMDNDFTIKLTDSLSLKELGVMVGYDTVTQLAIGFQGRVISNTGATSASLFAATQLNVFPKFVKVNMFSLAIAPSGNDLVHLSELFSNMFGIPTVCFPPAFHLISIGDILVKNGDTKSFQNLVSSINLSKKIDKPTVVKQNEVAEYIQVKEKVVNYFNDYIEDDLNINTSDLENVSIVPLESANSRNNYLITDHVRKIHYKIDFNGNLFLNSQFYFCINPVTIGGNEYKSGMFAAVLISILGQEVKFLVRIDDAFNLEAYATMSPVNLAGLLTISASKNKDKYSNNQVLEKNNGLFKQVMLSNANQTFGPELYLRMGKPANANSPFEFKTHGNITLLHLFEADAYVHLGDQMVVDFACKILNANLNVHFVSKETNDYYLTEFELAFQTQDFSKVIKEVQNSISQSVGNTQQKLKDAKSKLKEEEDRLYWQRENAKKEAQDRYNRMSKWDKFWYDFGNFIQDAVNAVGSVARSFTQVVIDVVGYAIEIGGWAFNRLLDAVDAIVSLIGKVISLNKLFISAKAQVNKVNPSLSFELKSAINLSLFGRNIDESFNFNFDFKPNADLFKAISTSLTDKVSKLIFGTEEYKNYVSAGKDENEPVTFNKVNRDDFKDIYKQTNLALEKVEKAEEQINYLKNIFNSPSVLESFIKENELTDEHVKQVQDLIHGNTLDLMSEINAINETLNDDEFKNKFEQVKQEIANEPNLLNEDSKISKAEILETFDIVNEGIKEMNDRINRADKARQEMLFIRSEERNKNIEIYDKYFSEKQKEMYDNLTQSLKSGTPIILKSKPAKRVFNQYLLQLTDPELILLATEALNKMNKNN